MVKTLCCLKILSLISFKRQKLLIKIKVLNKSTSLNLRSLYSKKIPGYPYPQFHSRFFA